MSFPGVSGRLDIGPALPSPTKLGNRSARGLGSRELRGAMSAPETLDGEGHNSPEACSDRVGDPDVAEEQGEMEEEMGEKELVGTLGFVSCPFGVDEGGGTLLIGH